MQRVEIGPYLVIDPELCHGQLTFRGTRVPVDTALVFLARGYSVDQILRNWPEPTRPAVEKAIKPASQALQEHYVPSPQVATGAVP